MSKIEIHDVVFKGSFPRYTALPEGDLPAYAFVGRSNVGKSSLINALTGRKKLARVSKTPGKTQLINLFEVEKEWHLVDLPGYGYAKESKKMRKKWDQMVRNYLQHAPNLVLAFVLVDSNIPLQARDLEFINWLGEKQLPFALVFTKVDRHRKRKDREAKINAIKSGLLEYWTDLPACFEVSAIRGDGKEEILLYIDTLNHSLPSS
ncbi:MAG: ribosome biogenesis GTP-binding protein YihA/YsxC [Saprospiraceae bacterium]|nr:ribosome biogenesis GTP-binding protein YihA/YsxC [Saprospiraceae bacterium]